MSSLWRRLIELLLPSCEDCGRRDCLCSRDPFGNLLSPGIEWKPDVS